VGSIKIKGEFQPRYGQRANQDMEVRLFSNCLSHISFAF
jgi:hypothetical protein